MRNGFDMNSRRDKTSEKKLGLKYLCLSLKKIVNLLNIFLFLFSVIMNRVVIIMTVKTAHIPKKCNYHILRSQ